MRNGWQLAAYYMIVIAGVACVPAGSKSTDDQVDDGSGGGGSGNGGSDTGNGGSDTEVTVEECYSGNPTREVAECMRTGEGLSGTPPTPPEGDAYYDPRNETCEQYLNDLGVELEYVLWFSTAENCWDLCDGGEECANETRAWFGCLVTSYQCVIDANSEVGCDNVSPSRIEACTAAYNSCVANHPPCAI